MLGWGDIMKRAVAVLLAVMLLFAATTNVMAYSDIDDKKQELNEVNREKKETEENIKQVQQQQQNVMVQLESIDRQIVEKEKELEKLEQDLKATQEELEKARQELEQAIKDAQKQEKLMAERVRTIYMNGVSSYLELLLEARSINQFLDRLIMVKRLLAFDLQVLEKLEACRERIDQKCTELEEKEQIIAEKKQAVAAQKKQIENKREEKNALLQQLKKQEQEYEQQLEELDKTSQELEKLIQQLLRELELRRQREEQLRKQWEQQQKEQQSRGDGGKGNQSGSDSGSGSKYTGGTLAWPVPGFYRITSYFGYRIHPVYGTRKLHSGIDIGSNNDESIYGKNFVAAADGTVIFAGWYGGYGNCVIIEHGGGMTTLYAHGSAILVSTGQQVKRGQAVLKVGSTGVSTGPHAHFEVRKDGVPVDPLPYLGR